MKINRSVVKNFLKWLGATLIILCADSDIITVVYHLFELIGHQYLQ